MPTCEVSGNEYDKAMEISVAGGQARTFASLECAIHALAPRCAHCGCAIIGHGQEAGGSMYCCAHCAREAGHAGLADRSHRVHRGRAGEHRGIARSRSRRT